MPPGDPGNPSAYERARSEVLTALSRTEDRLADLRKQRDEINAEIKSLVTEQDLLQRMSKIQSK